MLATAACFELKQPQPKDVARTLGLLAGGAISLLAICAAWTAAFFYFALFHNSTLQSPPQIFRISALAALALAVMLRKVRLPPALASAGLAAALLFELALGASWFGRPTYEERASFTEIASLPANGSLLAPSYGAYVALAFPGCVRLESDKFPVYFHDPRYAYYLRDDRWRDAGFDAPPMVTYREIERRGARPGSPLVKSLVAVAGVAGNAPRVRLWLWKGPGRITKTEHCCDP